MRFGPLQLNYFSAGDGAYSIVTHDERDNSQITLTEADGESEIAISALGRENIPRRAARGRASEVFVRRPDGTELRTTLTINFPKAAGDELRIYRNAVKGFDYEAGDVWFVFRRGRELFVGAMPEPAWRAIGRRDPEDDRYIELAEEAIVTVPDPRRVQALQYRRDPELTRQRFEQAGFRCEFDPDHYLFTARVTGRPFLEPHHLVQVSLQQQFSGYDLDHLDNIFALCPRCHRAVHHAHTQLVEKIITTLLDRRAEVCERFNLAPPEIFRLYNCESITR